MNDSIEPAYRFKVILLGNVDVGKTSLIIRFTEGTFDPEPKSEIDQKIKDVDINGKICRIILTDTAGQERFRTLTSSYYRNADAIITVFDITDNLSFTDCDGHLMEAARYSPRSIKFLVGNKIDLKDSAQCATDEKIEQMGEQFDAKVFKTSAKEGTNVNDLFTAVAEGVLIMQSSGDSGGPTSSKKSGNRKCSLS